ncbi:thiamine-phosphate kinase [Bradyrhizobium sp. AUGA SZCCT0431]|uniref:thiamine-phosphate kinase n=1 Tax=Bradyrhizobium sp. AUGA SZCCT0431 TaxID=2807674 RepID=UPI001BA6EE95|nr:thiamine-phosphate kinase [Bradyrhizobium sp. AUGA SZCCT0431]MBR1142018.1 thiamine-phosphate kinase [Bradyrhizobium sp. AUGA SZCCT0431]
MTNRHENASGEDSLIARYFRPIATDPGAFNLDDDAAALKPTGDDIVVTTDAIVEGVHFLPDDPPDTVARKALRVNLSDLAAKGAVPAGFVLTLALRDTDEAWLKPFAAALGEDAKHYGCPLLGGDTVSTPGPLMVSVTAFGRVPSGKMVHRSGARPGDRVLVTGTIGDAALGLAVLGGGKVHAAVSDAAARDLLIGRYRVPQPRVVLAEIVRDHAGAAMDVSDGLAGDLTKLCGVSGVSAAIDLESIPRSDTARDLLSRGIVGIETLIAGGDDYEILCTVAEDRVDAFVQAAQGAGVAVSSIGTVIAGNGAPKFLDGQGGEIVLKRRSYSHF